MYSLFLIAVLFAASVAVLAAVLQRLARGHAPSRPPRYAGVWAVVGSYLVAAASWWLAQPQLSDDDDIGGVITVFLTVWLCGLSAVLYLGDRRLGRALGRWLAYGLAVAAVAALEAFVVDEFVLVTARPLLVADMSPTLRYRHSVRPCPACGGEFVVTVFPQRGADGAVRTDEGPGVCANCLHSERRVPHLGPVRSLDHYVVNRLMAPERWRVVAFARGGRRSFPSTGRVVGLPGETIVLRDGAVWADGVRQNPPPGVAPLRYSESLPPWLLEANPLLNRPARPRGYAHPDEPLVLGADEYFVLRDDPGDPSDGRYSGPVRRSDYLGVVELVYWPPTRWGRVR